MCHEYFQLGSPLYTVHGLGLEMPVNWLEIVGPAWCLGASMVLLTAPLGCLLLWRRMAFFADTLAHGSLLGVALASLLGAPLGAGVFAVSLVLVLLLQGLQDRRLPMESVLGLCSATLLCLGMLAISQVPVLRSNLQGYLFGDLLAVGWQDVPVLLAIIGLGAIVLATQWTAQLRVAIQPEVASTEGISPTRQRLIFMLVLALFTTLAIQAVGSLLMGALLIIPALTARLLSHSPLQMVCWSAVVAEVGVAGGVWSSVWLGQGTGPLIVVVLALIFGLIFLAQKLWSRRRHRFSPKHSLKH